MAEDGLLAPVYGTLKPADGFKAPHAVNAVLMASAARIASFAPPTGTPCRARCCST